MPDSPSIEALRDDRDSFGLQVAGGAHHLNNIFAQVLLNAELLDRSRLDEVGAGMLDSIVQGVHSAIVVVDALAAQSTRDHGLPAAINLKYLVKGLQKRRDSLFAEGVVINAQYPQRLRLAWARPAPLFGAVMALCQMTVSGAPERQALFVQVEDVDLEGGGEAVAIDIAAPLPLVEAGLKPGKPIELEELSEIMATAEESGATVEVTASATGGTLIRFLYQVPPENF
jgi:hypothetical protein